MDKLLNEYRAKLRDCRLFASRICYYGQNEKGDLVKKYQKVILDLDEYLKNILLPETYDEKFDYILKNGKQAIEGAFTFDFGLFNKLKERINKEITSRIIYTLPMMDESITSLTSEGSIDYNPKDFSDNISKADSPIGNHIKENVDHDKLLRLYLNHLWFFGATKEVYAITGDLPKKINLIKQEIERKKEVDRKAKQEREFKQWRDQISKKTKDYDNAVRKREQLEKDLIKAKDEEESKKGQLDSLIIEINNKCNETYGCDLPPR